MVAVAPALRRVAWINRRILNILGTRGILRATKITLNILIYSIILVKNILGHELIEIKQS